MTQTIGGYDLLKPVWRPRGWLRIVIVLVAAAVMAYTAWQRQQGNQPPKLDQPRPAATENPPATSNRDPTPDNSAVRADPSPATPAVTPRTTIRDQVIFDQLGSEVFRGDIDVQPTLARIQDGRKLSFPNDGSVFQNRERRLPKQPAGYDKEYVHPTPGLSGPGPQRIVMGQAGEAYYTPDHYRTFQRVDGP
jgi:ribonuclease T1